MTNPICKTCNGSGKLQNAIEITFNDGSPPRTLAGNIIDCPDCTKPDYAHLPKAQQCEAKLRALLQEFGGLIYLEFIRMHSDETRFKVVLTTPDNSEITLIKGVSDFSTNNTLPHDNIFTYNGKTEVSDD